MNKEIVQALKAWLSGLGAEVLASTNPYEMVRFKAKGGTHVIYERANGKVTANGFAREVLDAFKNGRSVDMGIVKTKGMANKRHKLALVERDGKDCFFCGHCMPDEDMTVEHLIARNKGGSNTLENMALAHLKCNQMAGHLPLIEKIKMRERLLYGSPAEGEAANG